MIKSVIIPIANGSEELEFISIVNILRRGNINVIVYGTEDIIICARQTKIIPDIKSLGSIDLTHIDAIILPGGIQGVKNFSKNIELVNFVKNLQQSNKLVGAVCAAPQFLLEHNLIPKNAVLTSHPSIKQDFVEFNYKDENIVVYNNLITSRGAGTSLEFSFAILEYLTNKDLVLKIKQDICYKGI